MLTLRKSADRGHFDHSWLNTYHTFSFGDYYDPQQKGFRSLRVINDDCVSAGTGFETHPHRDMEIITYVLSGALEHQDSMGNGSIIRPGDVQRMTAGTGITHSERNPSPTEPIHLLQIWLFPSQKGLTPSYEQQNFSDAERRNHWRLIGSQDGRDGSVTIHQDVDLFATRLDPNQRLEHHLAADRHAWLQVAEGKVSLNGTELVTGDGAAVSQEDKLEIIAQEPSELLLFDLA